ncbi:MULTISPECIES: cold shock domain-containing protein [Actinokineospora]|uniref:cold shock domain-containing protein n=1 Tax=Actinokineospora TaxID=39845 RepID=UPI0027E4512B|nr:MULTISPECIES: cold shock domain-containing protein [Actinokineospora]
MAVVRGKVIRFDDVRGYGFVLPETGGEDVFLHVNDITFDKRKLVPGAVVEFVIEEGERGLKASDVSLVSGRATEYTSDPAFADDGDFADLLSVREFRDEVTEALLSGVPTLTAEQVVRVRQTVVGIARAHGWLDAEAREA